MIYCRKINSSGILAGAGSALRYLFPVCHLILIRYIPPEKTAIIHSRAPARVTFFLNISTNMNRWMCGCFAVTCKSSMAQGFLKIPIQCRNVLLHRAETIPEESFFKKMIYIFSSSPGVIGVSSLSGSPIGSAFPTISSVTAGLSAENRRGR